MIPDPSAAVFQPEKVKPGLLKVPCVGAVSVSLRVDWVIDEIDGAPETAVLVSKVTVERRSNEMSMKPDPPAPPAAPAPPPPPPPPLFAAAAVPAALFNPPLPASLPPPRPIVPVPQTPPPPPEP